MNKLKNQREKMQRWNKKRADDEQKGIDKFNKFRKQFHKSIVVSSVCSECGKEMDDIEHNYGTEKILVCIHCYYDAQIIN